MCVCVCVFERERERERGGAEDWCEEKMWKTQLRILVRMRVSGRGGGKLFSSWRWIAVNPSILWHEHENVDRRKLIFWLGKWKWGSPPSLMGPNRARTETHPCSVLSLSSVLLFWLFHLFYRNLFYLCLFLILYFTVCIRDVDVSLEREARWLLWVTFELKTKPPWPS